jgi:hypothetical protein
MVMCVGVSKKQSGVLTCQSVGMEGRCHIFRAKQQAAIQGPQREGGGGAVAHPIILAIFN